MLVGRSVTGSTDAEGCQWWGLRRGSMYIPDGLDDVSVPWYYRMQKRAEVAFPCNSLQCIRLEGWSLKQRLLVSRANYVMS